MLLFVFRLINFNVFSRFNLVSATESKGIGTFVGTFCLPALIFGSLCKLNLMSVNWEFLLAIFIAKGAIFFAVLLVTFLVSKSPGKSGLFAIFSTQSNDFALGNPILDAIYSVSHPDFQSYLYLFAPISLVILNPIGFVFMEIGRQQAGQTTWTLVKNVAKGVCTNPIIVMTFFGIIGNFAFGGQLPSFLDGFLSSLGDAFSASALFLLGLNIVNRSSKPSKINWIVPFMLIVTKTIVMPIIAREVVNGLKVGVNETDTQDWTDFAFLYGTFPTAPSVFVYAAKYDLDTDFMASSMVACTFISAPIMFISARLLSIKSIDPSDYINELDNFLLDISIVSLAACLWVIFVFVNSKKWNQMPHLVTMGLTVAQMCGCIGAIMWSVMNCHHGWKLYLQFIFFAFGVYASRINTALIAITLLLRITKSRCFVLKLRPYMILVGYLIPALLVLLMLVIVHQETPEHGAKVDPNFQYGSTQAVVSLVLLALSLATTIITLILGQRSRSNNAPVQHQTSTEDDPSRYLLEETTEDNSIPDLEDISSTADNAGGCSSNCRARVGAGRYRCDSEQRDYNSSLLERYVVPPVHEAVNLEANEPVDDFDAFKHTILLLLLTFSMFIGKALFSTVFWHCIVCISIFRHCIVHLDLGHGENVRNLC